LYQDHRLGQSLNFVLFPDKLSIHATFEFSSYFPTFRSLFSF
jgi:hypothetical protein